MVAPMAKSVNPEGKKAAPAVTYDCKVRREEERAGGGAGWSGSQGTAAGGEATTLRGHRGALRRARRREGRRRGLVGSGAVRPGG